MRLPWALASDATALLVLTASFTLKGILTGAVLLSRVNYGCRGEFAAAAGNLLLPREIAAGRQAQAHR